MKLLTVAEVADLMQATEGHVRTLCHSGKLPAVKVANQWRITPQHYRQYVGIPEPDHNHLEFSASVTGTDFYEATE